LDNFELKNVVSQSNLLLLGRENLKIPLYPPFSKGEDKRTFFKGGKIRKMPFSKGETNRVTFFKEGSHKSLPLEKGDLEGFSN